MRARRGAGVGGLAEMARARPLLDPRPGPPLIRPLLGWRRAKIAGVVAAAGIAPIEDPSNRHPRFDRSRIRGLLASTDELPTDRLAMAARNLRHAEEALTWATEREWAMRSRVDRESVGIDPSGLPYELRRRLALHAIRQVRAEFGLEGLWRETGIDRLVDLLDSGSAGTLAGVMARTKGSLWIFTPAPPRRSH
ncbi:MAG: ATP-binding protein [Sphingomonas sp.]